MCARQPRGFGRVEEALLKREGLLEIVHELLERLEAHLRADSLFMVTANVRGDSAEDVAAKLNAATLRGLQGPTIAGVHPATRR